MEIIAVVPAAAFLLVSLPLAWMAVHGYRTYQGIREIACPETQLPVAVRIDAFRAARTRLTAGKPELRLRSCSRWPEKQGCAQECLAPYRSGGSIPRACSSQRAFTRPTAVKPGIRAKAS